MCKVSTPYENMPRENLIFWWKKYNIPCEFFSNKKTSEKHNRRAG